jgi:uncharacterized peroxidase-related enzyme
MPDTIANDDGELPEASIATLERVARRYGFVPNVYRALALSPATVKGFFSLHEALDRSSFTHAEQQLLFLTISRENGCEYCVAAHSWGGEKVGLDAAAITALRAGRSPDAPRLAALHDIAVVMVRERGWVDAAAADRFLAAGFNRAQLLEVVLAVAMKVISNYANHLDEPALDAQFEPHRWP